MGPPQSRSGERTPAVHRTCGTRGMAQTDFPAGRQGSRRGQFIVSGVGPTLRCWKMYSRNELRNVVEVRRTEPKRRAAGACRGGRGAAADAPWSLTLRAGSPLVLRRCPVPPPRLSTGPWPRTGSRLLTPPLEGRGGERLVGAGKVRGGPPGGDTCGETWLASNGPESGRRTTAGASAASGFAALLASAAPAPQAPLGPVRPGAPSTVAPPTGRHVRPRSAGEWGGRSGESEAPSVGAWRRARVDAPEAGLVGNPGRPLAPTRTPPASPNLGRPAPALDVEADAKDGGRALAPEEWLEGARLKLRRPEPRVRQGASGSGPAPHLLAAWTE